MNVTSDIDLALLGKTPVRAGRPTGEYAKEDPEFNDLQAEVQKAVSVSSGEAADWEKIVALASKILAEKSKDMVVAGYLAVALIHSRGFEGFVIGSGVYMDLIENYWDDLYPAKARRIGRSRAIEWWIEKTMAALNALGPVALPVRQSEALARRFESTYLILKNDLEDCPSVRPIIEWMTSEPVPSATPSVNNASDVLPSASVPAEILSEAQAKQTFSRIVEDARKISAYLSSQGTANPAIYRLNRLCAWITVEELPVVKDGRTLLPSPEQRLSDHLANLSKRGDHAALVKLAEEESIRYLFWFDLHRLSAQALGAMGDSYKNAAETVRQETAAFVKRMRGIDQLAFADGKPFADAETRRWLEALLSGPGEGESSTAPAQAPRSLDVDGIRQTMEEIGQLVRGRKTGEAALRFQARLRISRSARERFMCRLEFVSALTHTPGGALMAPQIEAILEDIETYRLNEFDPALALRGLTIALKACRAEPDAVSKTKVKELLHRVAKIDMVEFIKHGG